MASSFLVHELTGEYVLDHHSASQCTPLYDSREQDVVTPDPEAGETYDELYRLYRGLYPATRGAAHVLAALSRRMA